MENNIQITEKFIYIKNDNGDISIYPINNIAIDIKKYNTFNKVTIRTIEGLYTSFEIMDTDLINLINMIDKDVNLQKML